MLLSYIAVNFMHTGVSGFDQSVIFNGRPYGGFAILWRSDSNVAVHIIDTNSRQICAVRMINDNCRLLYINVH